ncbi:hypothetical protein AMJ80_00595 [bacterium SM23_31]|nr:MAG: hypothetical protein AMJ80_00595 [bacterium SM23_31]
MISAKNISKKFGGKQVLFSISFDVNKGEILGFLGPNAAGKTTAMRILTCFLLPNEGTATVAGFDILEQSIDVRRNIGYMPESPPIYPEMSVQSYLEFVAWIKGIKMKDIPKRIDAVMEKTSITHVRDRICGRLSKGYRQRVGLAQALIHNPPVLILDEPTSGLDPKQIIEVRELIKGLAGEHTVIVSTHILPEVKLTCERVIIINNGWIVAQGTPENLTQKIKGKERLQLEIGGPGEEVKNALRNVPGVANVQIEIHELDGCFKYIVETEVKADIKKNLARIIADNKWDLYEMRTLGMTLEEIFMRYTTGETFTEKEA